jgi:hypothetical protein
MAGGDLSGGRAIGLIRLGASPQLAPAKTGGTNRCCHGAGYRCAGVPGACVTSEAQIPTRHRRDSHYGRMVPLGPVL